MNLAPINQPFTRFFPDIDVSLRSASQGRENKANARQPFDFFQPEAVQPKARANRLAARAKLIDRIEAGFWWACSPFVLALILLPWLGR
jgi:hypothetical protein